MYYLVRALLDFALYGRSGSLLALGFGILAVWGGIRSWRSRHRRRGPSQGRSATNPRK